MTTQQERQKRIQELEDLSKAEGITLPYEAAFILAQEDLGNVVDLVTGAIILNEADAVYTYTLTPKGKELARLIKGEV